MTVATPHRPEQALSQLFYGCSIHDTSIWYSLSLDGLVFTSSLAFLAALTRAHALSASHGPIYHYIKLFHNIERSSGRSSIDRIEWGEYQGSLWDLAVCEQ